MKGSTGPSEYMKAKNIYFCHTANNDTAMSYFSKDEHKRTKFIFDLIAPVYHLIDKKTGKDFEKMAAMLNEHIPLKGLSALDIGTGTGSWIAALSRYGLSKVHGVDFSEKMIAEAKKKHPEIAFSVAHAGDLGAFGDGSFDIVTASFVLHGMKKDARTKVLGEMKRVTKRFVIIQDFYRKSNPFIYMLEWLERSDYPYFKKHFADEMKGIFSKTEVLTAHNGNGIYIGMKK